MKTYIIYSHDADDQDCTITIRCNTDEQAKAIANATAAVLRYKGILRGGSKVEKEEETVVYV